MRLALLMLLICPLTGCATLTPTAGTNATVCTVWRAVSWSSMDTTSTIVEVKQSNARRAGWCVK